MFKNFENYDQIAEAYSAIYTKEPVKTDFVLYRGVDSSEGDSIFNSDGIAYTTDDLESAEMYAEDSGVVFEIGIDNGKIKSISDLKIEDEYGEGKFDLYNLTDEDKELFLGEGYNVVTFNTGSYDVYILLNDEMISYIKKIEDTDETEI